MSQPPPIPADEMIPDAIEVGYALPDTSDVRPGLITALGVASIVVSVMQAGTAIMVGFMAFALSIISVIPPPQPYQATVATTNFPDGLSIERAARLSNRLTDRAKLSGPRHVSLDALLRQSGRDIAPTMLAGDINAASVKRLLVSSAKDSDGHDLLILPTGRIELTDTEATFEPSDSTQVISVETASMDLNAVASSPATMPVNARPQVKVSGLALTTWFVTSAGAGLLCILLLIAGILTLRGNQSGRRLHLWWAWLKLPIAIIGAVGVGWMFATFAAAGTASAAAVAPASAAPKADDVVVGVVVAVIQGVLSVAYIVAVLIVMNLKHVRAWYATR